MKSTQIVEANHNPLPVTEAIALILKVADALSHVHEVGLLHRDIKPDNVLRSEDGRVVLLDFGLATDFNRRGHYTTRQLQTVLSGGTPGYAPLEQYSQRADLTPATDVYALSATLYFLLTGQDPLPATDRIIGTTLPEPRVLNPNVSPAVSSTVLEGMALESARRSPSVKEWANRLQISISQPSPANSRPLSPPASAPAQPVLFPNTPSVAPAALKTLTPLTRPASASVGVWKVVFSPSQHHVQGITDLDFAPAQGVFGPHVLMTAGKDGQLFVWEVKSQKCMRSFEHPAGILAARFSANGQLIFAGCDDQRLYVWDVESGKTTHVSDKFKHPIVSLAVSPLGNQIALGCEARESGGKWQGFLYDGEGQTLIKKLPTDYGYISTLDYSPDGCWLAQGTFGAYTIWDATHGHQAHHFDAYGGSGSSVQCVRFSPDGENLAASYWTEPIKIWKAATGELVRSFGKIKNPKQGIAFSPQPPLIALAGENQNGDTEILLLNVETGQQFQKLPMGTWQSLEAIGFSSDGQFLAAGSDYDEPVLRVYGQT